VCSPQILCFRTAQRGRTTVGGLLYPVPMPVTRRANDFVADFNCCVTLPGSLALSVCERSFVWGVCGGRAPVGQWPNVTGSRWHKPCHQKNLSPDASLVIRSGDTCNGLAYYISSYFPASFSSSYACQLVPGPPPDIIYGWRSLGGNRGGTRRGPPARQP